MTDEPRTVREAGHTGVATLTGLVAFADGNPIHDALIGAQGRVIYTVEDVERAITTLNEWLAGCGFDVSEYDLRHATRAVITAAGGVVVDEFWEVDCPATIKIRDEDKSHTKLLMYGLLPGDKLYIERAEEE